MSAGCADTKYHLSLSKSNFHWEGWRARHHHSTPAVCTFVLLCLPTCTSTFAVATLLCILSLALTLLQWSLGMIGSRLHSCAYPHTHIPFWALLRSFFTCANSSSPSCLSPLKHHARACIFASFHHFTWCMFVPHSVPSNGFLYVGISSWNTFWCKIMPGTALICACIYPRAALDLRLAIFF
jgi:hypothetical protein